MSVLRFSNTHWAEILETSCSEDWPPNKTVTFIFSCIAFMPPVGVVIVYGLLHQLSFLKPVAFQSYKGSLMQHYHILNLLFHRAMGELFAPPYIDYSAEPCHFYFDTLYHKNILKINAFL